MKSSKKEPIKKRDRGATEKALVKAATQLFASKGYDGTRTLEIAQKAKVNEALIARYFGGKEGLLLAVMKDDEASKQIINSKGHPCPSTSWIPTLDRSEGLQDAFSEFFGCGLNHFQEKESFIRIALSQALVDPKMSELLRSKTFDESVPLMSERLKKHFKKKKNHVRTIGVSCLTFNGE
jgi:AcrR family transcriptional regulator